MKQASTIWGGRFDSKVDDVMERINASIDTDKRLYKQDIAGSKAHAGMLAKQGILSAPDGAAIQKGLDQIEAEIESGKFVFRRELEDIHMNIETRLRELIGDAAGRLHTARSRNDQVATDFRLWVRDACDTLVHEIEGLQKTLSAIASAHTNTVMPGFTHLQVAQPVTLSVHLDAYVQMLARDAARIRDCRVRLNECPLGAAAMAGTPYPIDRDMTARALGFDRPMANTMDAVGARDFVNEFLFGCVQTGLHLSRLAEEIVLWTTPQFGFMRLADSWSTGSSIMPQKKNPDAAELVRGKTGQLTGQLVRMLMIMKALPMTYNKDLQDDKESAFTSFDTLALCIAAMDGMLTTATWNTDAMKQAAETGFATATRLADWLVMNVNLPFRDAHHVTGAIVKHAEGNGKTLKELTLAELQVFEPRITHDILKVL